MENAVKYKKYDFSTFNFPLEKDEDKDEFLKTSDENDEIESESFLKPYEFSPEDSGAFLKNLFRGKEIILNENWEVNESIQGKILSFDKYEVYVDCLIDLEKNVIQSRRFPINLFNNLSKIDKNIPVLIKTKLKPGAIRIDVYSGEGIVNLDVFEINDNWDSLSGKNLDSKLTKW
jgi:radical SAM superfamily enzyme YgiQ (UPF0313 family)